MACVIVPATEAVITTVATKVLEKKYKKTEVTKKLKWLSNLLWGGTALLTFEHVWHGEIQPWFPFLTAATNPKDTIEMLHEMSTVGVTMAVFITVIWFAMVMVSIRLEKKVDTIAQS